MSLQLRPVTLQEARAYVREHHRHSDAPVGHRVSVGIEDEHGVLRGVGMLGHPRARQLDDGYTAEVLRVATDGVRNGCSMLYGALNRAAWALGYRRVVTYTLQSESGASLRAAGYTRVAPVRDRYWSSSRNTQRHHERLTLFYQQKQPAGEKRWRWEITR